MFEFITPALLILNVVLCCVLITTRKSHRQWSDCVEMQMAAHALLSAKYAHLTRKYIELEAKRNG